MRSLPESVRRSWLVLALGALALSVLVSASPAVSCASSVFYVAAESQGVETTGT